MDSSDQTGKKVHSDKSPGEDQNNETFKFFDGYQLAQPFMSKVVEKNMLTFVIGTTTTRKETISAIVETDKK